MRPICASAEDWRHHKERIFLKRTQMPVSALFLQALKPDDRAAVMALAQPWTSRAEEVLFQAGQAVPCLWMLDIGLVRYEFLDHDGRLVVPAFSSPGACFGELEILEERLATVSAITSAPCEGWVMSAASALEAMDTVPAFSRLMLLKLARNVRVSQMLYQMALILGQHERLALALLNLAQKVPGQVNMVVPVTQETLCQVTGSSRQLVSKYLRQWTDLGWIAPGYGAVEILDMAGLKSIFPKSVNPEVFMMLARHAKHASANPGDQGGDHG